VKLVIEPASEDALRELGTWKYGAPYELYDRDDGLPVRNPERFYSARDQTGALVGFYYFEDRGETLDYGLGLRPDLTGQGLGLEFVEAGLEFARERFRAERITLNVAAFNERARIVYERAGFQVVGSHVRDDIEFLDMEEA
jgi:RimJ/RimL family protein N-acetyltransferase